MKAGRAAGRRGRGGGYTLVALLVGMTVASILIAAVLPLASAQAQREKEAELIFRGLQYAEGIRIFRRRFGRYPNSLGELLEVKPRSVRKLWKDPMTKDGEWGIVSQEGVPVVTTQTGLKGRPTPTPTPTPTPSPFKPPPGAGGGDRTGPVLGVYSKSTERGYRLWEGREAYNEWKFTEASLTSSGRTTGTPGPGVF
ncbi:MAG TPA: type II secretion system protein [Thermoanaerobaculia bacterium]|nr:type II secretion system protein [Thermoanaerobaculia bacterium]HQN06912.1 type II secretion system protein [Thermoanaerobaculia bacterium]